MNNNNKRWPVLISGAVLMLVAGLIYAWSIFRAPLTGLFPEWTPTQLSVAFTVSMVFFCLGGFTAGKLAARMSGRFIILIAAAMLLIGFCGVALLLDADHPAKSLWALYLLYGILCGGGVGLVYNAALNTLTKWFPENPGMVSGVLLMCFGFGGLALGSIVNALIGSRGLSPSFLILGIGVGIIFAIASFLFKWPPAGKPAGETKEAAVRAEATTKEMLRSPIFWALCLWNIALCIGGLLVINSAATIASAFGAAPVAGLLVSVFNGVGRVSIGALHDRKGRHFSMTAGTSVLLLAGIILSAGAFLNIPILIFIGLPLVGISFGRAPPSISTVVNNYFGPKHYAVNLSTATFSVIPGAIIGPIVSSRLQEASGGAYGSTFIMIIVIAILALVLNFALRYYSKKSGFE
ncbi:MAG: MFS transporter [Clostridiales Family XIII bacterium]|nr:MFS transporter [Clostridiales Family XIII bacterium]